MRELQSRSTKLLPVRLRELWSNAPLNNLTSDECARRQNLELDEYAAIWTRALLLPRESDLIRSTLIELGRWRGISDLELVRRGCEGALHSNKLDWERRVHRVKAHEVKRYYDIANYYIELLNFAMPRMMATIVRYKAPSIFSIEADGDLRTLSTLEES